MSDSDDEPWPGACCGRTRYVGREYYRNRYTMAEPFLSFFGIDPRPRYTMYDIEGVVLEYITSHKGYTGKTGKTGKTVAYDEGLWALFGLSPDTPCPITRLLFHIESFREGYNRPCPVCERPRPFHPYDPNRLCEACTSDLLVQKRDVSNESNRVTLHGVPCRRSDHKETVFEAIVYCPLCRTEVNEERRLGAFCDRCASSECLVDENGNRVRFTRPKDIGFTVVHYENGEIVETSHLGEFTCFFQGVECVADDIGVHDRVIVRCRDRTSETRTWLPIALPRPQSAYASAPTATASDEATTCEVGPATDWLDPRYPRWAAYEGSFCSL